MTGWEWPARRANVTATAVGSMVMQAGENLTVSVVHPWVAAAPSPPPAQLPCDINDFTGCQTIIGKMTSALTRPEQMPVCVIHGMAGVGKTALAVRVAHSVRSRFPDGQLYADLHGVGGTPTSPADVAGDFLAALGVPQAAVPSTVEQRAALLRTHLDGKKILIVLDNAHDSAQVTPLLPGGPGAAVLVTSRSRLTELPGATNVELDVLTRPDAIALLNWIVGTGWASGDVEAAGALVDACGRLPLALRIVGSRLVRRPSWTIADLAARLCDEQCPLGELRSGDLAIEAAFDLSYQQLDDEQRRAFHLLAGPDSNDIPLGGAAAIIERDPQTTERICESLVDLHLLRTTAQRRYTYHDLMRRFARERGAHQGHEPVERLLDYHLAAARDLNAVAHPGTTVPADRARTRSRSSRFTDTNTAFVWLRREQHNLTRLTRQAGRIGGTALDLAAEIAVGTADPNETSDPQSRVASLETVLAAAIRAENAHAERRLRIAIGTTLCWAQSRPGPAREHLKQALSIPDVARASRLSGVAAIGLLCTAWVFDPDEVQRYYEMGLYYAQRTDDRILEAATHATAALALRCADADPEEAWTAARDAARIADRHGHPVLQSFAHRELAATVVAAGHGSRADAVASCCKAVRLARGCGSLGHEGWSLVRLSETQLLADRPTEAAATARLAIELARAAVGPGLLVAARIDLGAAEHAMGRTRSARKHFRHAVQLRDELDILIDPHVAGLLRRYDEPARAELSPPFTSCGSPRW